MPKSNPLAHSPRRKAATTGPKAKVGGVRIFVRDRVLPSDGERTEIKALMQDYRAWCAQKGCTPIALSAFLDEIETLCRTLGVEVEVDDDQRVYSLDVRLGTATTGGLATAVH